MLKGKQIDSVPAAVKSSTEKVQSLYANRAIKSSLGTMRKNVELSYHKISVFGGRNTMKCYNTLSNLVVCLV